MTLVVLLRGVNVGGHRVFRPAVLAKELRGFEVVNVGAAGTFVVRAPVSRSVFREALAQRLPFETDVMICSGADVLRLAASEPFADEPSGPDIVRFVSLLAKARQPSSPLPRHFPDSGRWGLKVAGQQGRFVYGVYRREMKAVGYLSQIDRLFGVPATTRSWSTILTLARLVSEG